MSEPLQVRVSRDGKEFGTYSAQEAVRLLVYGTLKETDFYWHEGMTDWAPLSQLQAAEARRLLAERALKQKQEEERKAAELARQRREEAERLAQEKTKQEDEECRLREERIKVEEARRKATWFRCNCCRESFNEPENSGSYVGLGVVMVFGSGIVSLLSLESSFDRYSGSAKGLFIGQWIAAAIFFLGLVVINVCSLKPPYCPKCKSTDFSKPEKTDE